MNRIKIIRVRSPSPFKTFKTFQEYSKKDLFEKGIGFLLLSPPYFLFKVRTQAKTAQFRAESKLDCSKNKKIRAKVDSTIERVWRLREMGSCPHWLIVEQLKHWYEYSSELGRLLGITWLVLWSRKPVSTSQPITWKPKTFATRTLAPFFHGSVWHLVLL